jgi:uncharacterized OB-fold protein
MADYKLPLPQPTILHQPMWDAFKQHRLVVQRCRACDMLFIFAREHCPRCWATDLEWYEVSGRGRLYTYTTVRQPAHPAFNDLVPYVYAIVQLDEGPRLPSNLMNVALEDVKVDMPLRVVWDDVTPEFTLPKFEPDPDGLARRMPHQTGAPRIHASGVPAYTPAPQ